MEKQNKNTEEEFVILDLYCGVGGSAVGLERAWRKLFPNRKLRIIGVDINPQPNYPFEFVKADVTQLTELEHYDFIWASPPCQSYTFASKKARNKGKKYPDCVKETRDLLLKSGKPSVIENVTTAPIRKDLILCGEMFGFKVIRHRAFEINGFEVRQPEHKKHKGSVKEGFYVSVAGHGGDGKASLKAFQDAMDIHWTKNKKSICEAVHPGYSEFIFTQYLTKLNNGNNGIPPKPKVLGILPNFI
jgi:DNA (cytosine-5)-methyltransferase 1